MTNTCPKRNNRDLGKWGERIAVEFLKSYGVKIIQKNFHSRFGEIDIIAREGLSGQLIFVEVKTRLNKGCGFPEESVQNEKIKKIKKCAFSFFEINGLYDDNYRFDVISIIINRKNKTAAIKHFKSFF